MDQASFPTLGGGPPAQDQAQASYQAMPMPMPMQQPVQQAVPVTVEQLAQVGSPEQQKQFLGEHLYTRVAQVDSALAGRIVGMMLDAYTQEQILQNLADPASLQHTISEAVKKIKEHESATSQ